METFILKLTIVIIPLVVLVASVTIFSKLYSSWYTHHPLSWHRTRHSILRTLASGVMLR